MRFSCALARKSGHVQFDHRRVGKFNPFSKSTAPPKTMFVEIHAQQSTGAAPLGPVLAARGITMMKFNDDFNNRTVQYESGVPLRTRVNFEGAGKWNIQVMSPPLDFHILQASGLDQPSHDKKEIMGKLTLKHVYEIAAVHAKDDWYIARDLDERKIVTMIIHRCKELGVKVESGDLDAVEYRQFRAHAEQLRSSYLRRVAEEEAARAEEIRRKAAEARKLMASKAMG